ncbi:MAG: hypothetical protein QF632_05550 [Candidatus Woesearchaeota archaeon]|jgi:hypothetical protein|nr:hypothetical protein [Candidatus Woesearchaeota archaeon]MDP7324196.1 hypothetical protein [Candidatus Woesearchaeota archaeon]MDP7457412.1 hypothetical protein [Candidatus Woesearchaeota archaeon]
MAESPSSLSDHGKFLSMIKNHSDGLSHQAKLIMPPISDGWFLTKRIFHNIKPYKLVLLAILYVRESKKE